MKKTAKRCIAILSIFLLLAQSLLTPFFISSVYAATSWTQTDWSGGNGKTSWLEAINFVKLKI
ncbi:MAG: hypothetical protein Q8P72_06520 [Candidatus Roizmanbacteria bacterium]|nr:hypothetical protein [Candidatus Roizmanbacteria bacterium]